MKRLPPAIYGLVLVLAVSPVSASIGDNLSGSLLEAVNSVKEDTNEIGDLHESVSENTASIEELRKKVDAIGESTTSIQYSVSAANGNKVTIPAQSTINTGSSFSTLQQSFYDWVEEEYGVSMETDYYEVLDGSLDKDGFSKVVFRDKVSGYEFSINGYDSKKDELKLWMRQIVGGWKQVAPYSEHSGYYGVAPGCPITLTNALATEKFQVWKENNCEHEGILSKVSSVNTGLNYCSTENQRSIPEENRSYWDGEKSVTWDTWWVRSSSSYTSLSDGDISEYYLHYTGLTSGAFEYHLNRIKYESSYHWACCYTSPEYGFAPGLVLQGDLGEYEPLKTLVSAWQVYSNTVSGKIGTGLVVPYSDFHPSSSKKLDSGSYKYALTIDNSENQLTSVCEGTIVTATAGGEIGIPYTSTMSTKKVVNTTSFGDTYTKFVDVVIRDSSQNILYWGRVANAKMGDNLAVFEVPKDLEEDTVYVVQIFEETCWHKVVPGCKADVSLVSTISTPVNMQLVIGE